MREISFDLKKYENISGTLKFTVPSYSKRLKMIKDCNFKINEEGKVIVDSSAIDSLIKLLELTKEYFTTVDIKCGQIKAKSYEELETYGEFDALLTEASTSIMNAGKLGK